MPRAEPGPATDRPAVTIVGGGIAGLVLARDLAIADVRVTLLEARAELGGQVAAATVAGVEVDLGADAVPAGDAAVARLAAELGLEVVPPDDGALWVVHGPAESYPLPTAHLLGIPATPLAREVVALAGAWGALRAQLDSLIPLVRAAKYRDVEELVRRRMGRRVLERLVAPVVRGVHGPGPLALDAAAPRLAGALALHGTLAAAVAAVLEQRPGGADRAGLRGGVHRLASTLAARAARVGVEIRTNARVIAVDADRVELATGERVAGSVVAAHAPPGPAAASTVVVAAVDSRQLDAPSRGARAVVAAGASGIGARTYAHSSSIWPWLGEQLPPHRHLVRLVYDEAPADPAAVVVADLRSIAAADDTVVVDLASRTWSEDDAAPASPPIAVVGEAAAGRGLGAVIEHARRTAADLIDDWSA